ncbi:EAL domain-containing protein [Cohnella cellulosilytica]|uniref:EAL domain-containing protein n=1 Tax=Cohnella cellulosilytica TaxID=986710 RepID=A0ABW2FFD6_9BACL
MSNLPNNNVTFRHNPQGQLLAYYQPIVAMESREIIGYEALGRERVDGTVRSLGPFFADSSVSVEEHVRIDRILREQAIAKLSALTEPPLLFVNLKPSWIYRYYKDTGELHTLQLLYKYGVDPRKVCIEITEDEFGESLSELTQIVELYRQAGCQIAIDDIGTGFSNFDRIARIRPNLLKIDIVLMKKSATHSGYLGVLRSFSNLAEQIGASLLLEGVETNQDLKRAIQAGARYVQGYLFSQAQADFQEKRAFTPLIEAELDAHRVLVKETRQRWERIGSGMVKQVRESGIRELLERRMPNDEEAELADEAIRLLLPRLDDSCMRVYLCRTTGIQLSANHARSDKEIWEVNLEYRYADWSWRPYFIPHLSRAAAAEAEAKISEKYADLDTHLWIRTVSIPINDELVLLTDVIDSFE